MRVASAAAYKHVTTIIIVEDDSSVNLAVSRLLEAAGFTTRSFTSGGALLVVRGLLSLPLSDIKAAHEAWLPGYMAATE